MHSRGTTVSTDSITASLKDLEVFRGLHQRQLTSLVQNAERIVYRAGQNIISEGQPGDGAILIVAGEAEIVEASGERLSQKVAPGSLVGELAMLIEHDYRITVVAKGNVRALKISRDAMYEMMLTDRSLTEHFISRLSSRLSRIAIELRRVDGLLALATEPANA